MPVPSPCPSPDGRGDRAPRFQALSIKREARYMSAMSNYELDVNEWTKEQADALRRRAPNELDWDNLAEEIEFWAAATGARSSRAWKS